MPDVLDFPLFYLRLFEILGILLYILCVIHSLRNQKLRATVVFFVAVTIYAWFLEEMGVLFWKSYFYNPQFLIFIDKTPLAVTFGWAAIVYSGIRSLPNVCGSPWQKALFVSIYA